MRLTRDNIKRIIQEENTRLLSEGFMDDLKSFLKNIALGYRDTMALVNAIKNLADETDQSAVEIVAFLTAMDMNTLEAANNRNGVAGIVELLTQRLKGMGTAGTHGGLDFLGLDALSGLPSMPSVERAIDTIFDDQRGYTYDEDKPSYDEVSESTIKVSHKQLIKIIKEELSRVVEGEIVDFPGGPKPPWVFGPDGYIKRPQLTQQYEKKQDIGADSPPEVMVARALAYRASELTNYQQEFDDEIFSDYAMRIYHDYVLGKSGDKSQSLDSILNRIDDGGWDDEEIIEIASAMQMLKTKDLAAQQDPDDVESYGELGDFEKYLQGIESGKVVELEQEEY